MCIAAPGRAVRLLHGEPASRQRQRERVHGVLVGRRPRQPDAVRDTFDGVERVDERVAAGIRVQRVHPAAGRRRRAVDRPALHHPALLRLVGDPAFDERVCTKVVRAHDVVLEVLRRGVLDQVELRAVRRERVEAVVPVESDRVAHGEVARPEDRELRGVFHADALEHEGAAVVEEPAGEPVVGQHRNAPVARKRCRPHDGDTAGTQGLDLRAARRLERDETHRSGRGCRGLSGHPGRRTASDTRPRRPGRARALRQLREESSCPSYTAGAVRVPSDLDQQGVALAPRRSRSPRGRARRRCGGARAPSCRGSGRRSRRSDGRARPRRRSR